jgi:hypothetical protein
MPSRRQKVEAIAATGCPGPHQLRPRFPAGAESGLSVAGGSRGGLRGLSRRGRARGVGGGSHRWHGHKAIGGVGLDLYGHGACGCQTAAHAASVGSDPPAARHRASARAVRGPHGHNAWQAGNQQMPAACAPTRRLRRHREWRPAARAARTVLTPLARSLLARGTACTGDYGTGAAHARRSVALKAWLFLPQESPRRRHVVGRPGQTLLQSSFLVEGFAQAVTGRKIERFLDR